MLESFSNKAPFLILTPVIFTLACSKANAGISQEVFKLNYWLVAMTFQDKIEYFFRTYVIPMLLLEGAGDRYWTDNAFDSTHDNGINCNYNIMI